MIYYGYFRSSASYRCRIAFGLLGVNPELHSIHLGKGEQRRDEFSAVNPQQFVPALVDDNETITQSLAIIEYLNETQNGNLLGDDPMSRAHIRSFSQIIACDIHPLQNLRVLQYIDAEFGQSTQAEKDKWCQKWLSDGLTACEVIAGRQTHGGRFVFGDAPSLADICLVPQIFSAHRFHVNLTAMPRLVEIYENCQTLPAFADAAPEKQPDAV